MFVDYQAGGHHFMYFEAITYLVGAVFDLEQHVCDLWRYSPAMDHPAACVIVLLGNLKICTYVFQRVCLFACLSLCVIFETGSSCFLVCSRPVSCYLLYTGLAGHTTWLVNGLLLFRLVFLIYLPHPTTVSFSPSFLDFVLIFVCSVIWEIRASPPIVWWWS